MPAPTSSLDNIRPLLNEYGDLHAKKKQIEARMKELDPTIRPMLEGRGSTVVDGYMFECSMQAGRKTLDKKAMEADGINLARYEKQGAPYTKLIVKAVNEE